MPEPHTAVPAPSTDHVYERLARQCIDTRYKLADGTELTASRTLMRIDLTNLAWAVIELTKALREARGE